jgi:putative pyruvate formate lyase activating enzyme
VADFEPSYLETERSGKLARKADELEARLESCDLCPRRCRVNRMKDELGFCHSGRLAIVSSYCAHKGEEPALSGTEGSGTIFFGNCNMTCVYCQNFQISQNPQGQKENEIEAVELAGKMLYLQNELGCHNINLVSPSHFVPQIVRALLKAIPLGLRVPLVYNSGGYDSLEIIRSLEGIIDIYLPDMRYASDEIAKKYSGAENYVQNNRAAIAEMYRQVGDLVIDELEIAQRGVIVRHLILPNRLAGSVEALTWLARQISPSITLSLMSQYYPTHKAKDIPELARSISYEEYREAADLLEELGLDNGWLQEMDAPANYLPDFERDGHPFEEEGEVKG